VQTLTPAIAKLDGPALTVVDPGVWRREIWGCGVRRRQGMSRPRRPWRL